MHDKFFGRGERACGPVPHVARLTHLASEEMSRAMENNVVHPFAGRVREFLYTFSRDKLDVAMGLYLIFGVGAVSRGIVIDVEMLLGMREVAASMDFLGQVERLDTRIQLTKAVLRWKDTYEGGAGGCWRKWSGWQEPKDEYVWSGVEFDDEGVTEEYELAALAGLVEEGMKLVYHERVEMTDDVDEFDDDFDDGFIPADEVADAVGQDAMDESGFADDDEAGMNGECDAGVSGEAAAGSELGVVWDLPDAVMAVVGSETTRLAEAYPAGIPAALCWNAHAIKKGVAGADGDCERDGRRDGDKRIWSCLDASIDVVSKLEKHNERVAERAELRLQLLQHEYRQHLREGGEGGEGGEINQAEMLEFATTAAFLVKEEQAGLKLDDVKDTTVRTFSPIPIGSMIHRHAPLDKIGLLKVLEHIHALPAELAHLPKYKDREEKFTNKMASDALQQFMSCVPEDKDGERTGRPSSVGLGIAPHVLINSVTTCFHLRPDDDIREKTYPTSKSSSLSYAAQRSVERHNRQSTVNHVDLWHDRSVVMPSQESMDREVFLDDKHETEEMWPKLLVDPWGVDVGENYVIYAVRMRPDEEGNRPHLSLSNEQLYAQCGYDERTRHVAALVRNSKPVQAFYADIRETAATAKTADAKKVERLLDAVVKHMDTIRDELWDKIGRSRAKEDFNVHRKRQACVASVVARFAELSDKPPGTSTVRRRMPATHSCTHSRPHMLPPSVCSSVVGRRGVGDRPSVQAVRR